MEQVQQVFPTQIERLISKGLKTKEDEREMLLYVGIGVLSVYREQGQQGKEIYGNGVPGGIKAQIASLKDFQEATKEFHETANKDMSEMKDDIRKLNNILMEEFRGEKSGRRKDDEKKDPFTKFVSYLVEKILPALIVNLIITITGILFLGAFVLFALQVGLITL